MKKSPLEGLHPIAACKEWLRTQRRELSDRTRKDYLWYLESPIPRTLREICKNRDVDYDSLKIEQLDEYWLLDYQDVRQAGPDQINKEIGVLTQCRDDMRMHIGNYKRLKKKKDYTPPGRKLPKAEYAALTKACIAAQNHKRWGVAALCTLLSLDSGMGPGEIANLTLANIRAGDGTEENPWCAFISPRAAKKKRRIRQVPLTVGGHGEFALKKLLERAHKLGSTDDDHFLLPKLLPGKRKIYDPRQHTDGWEGGWRALLRVAGIEDFREYDCRHHAISEGLEDPRVSAAAASSHFGHISEIMWRTYFHGDIETNYVVAQAISGRKRVERQQQLRLVKQRKKPMQKETNDDGPPKWAVDLMKAIKKA